jgi:hypothetical protein
MILTAHFWTRSKSSELSFVRLLCHLHWTAPICFSHTEHKCSFYSGTESIHTSVFNATAATTAATTATTAATTATTAATTARFLCSVSS